MDRNKVLELAQQCQLIGMRPHLDGIYEQSLQQFAALIEREVRGDAEQDANRYRWLVENSARFSWNPSRFNERIVDGFAAFGTGYLGYNFEQAVDLAMAAALADVKENGL